MTAVENFRRRLRNAESIYRRLDSGAGTGRNAHATGAALDHHLRELRELVRTDDVCDELDRDERLAARWNALERRYVGLPVVARSREHLESKRAAS